MHALRVCVCVPTCYRLTGISISSGMQLSTAAVVMRTQISLAQKSAEGQSGVFSRQGGGTGGRANVTTKVKFAESRVESLNPPPTAGFDYPLCQSLE